MRKEVVILGVGVTSFARVSGRSLTDMAREAGMKALKDAGVDFRDIQIGFCSHCNQPLGTGMECFAQLGMTGIPVTNVEVACASQTRGGMLAADLIAAGVYDMALVIGVEKMPRGMVPAGDINEMPYHFRLGIMPMPGAYAMQCQRHMHLYGSRPEHFAKAAEKAHRNGSLNPNATYRDVYTLEQIMHARMIADPITMLMCSANCDGATATVICSKKKAKKYKNKPIRLVGWAGGNPMYVKGREEGLAEGPTEFLGEKVYEMSGLGPEDVDVAQVHDAFSPGEIFTLEELGFCPQGEGGRFVWEGHTEIGGKIPVNTDGGLVSCGHPIGATGGRMIAELSWQLRGMAGARQIPGKPKVAMIHNQGLGGTNVMMLTL
ncbi:MAG: thiolase family protein [Deltaproteobacteria bacterium]|nr:thiolase family protein [Deltaproteobacteria bacterium]